MNKRPLNHPDFQEHLPKYGRPFITQCLQDIDCNLPTVIELFGGEIIPSNMKVINENNLYGTAACFITISHIINNQELIEYIGESIKEIARKSNLDVFNIEPKPLYKAFANNINEIRKILDKIQNSLPLEPDKIFGLEVDFLRDAEHLNYSNVSCALSLFIFFSITKMKESEIKTEKANLNFDKSTEEMNKYLEQVGFWHSQFLTLTRAEEYFVPIVEKIINGQISKEKAQNKRNERYTNFINWILKHPNSNNFLSGKDAVRKFITEMQKQTRDYDSVTERGMETYLAKLKEHCCKLGVENPIKPKN